MLKTPTPSATLLAAPFETRSRAPERSWAIKIDPDGSAAMAIGSTMRLLRRTSTATLPSVRVREPARARIVQVPAVGKRTDALAIPVRLGRSGTRSSLGPRASSVARTRGLIATATCHGLPTTAVLGSETARMDGGLVAAA